MQKQLAKIIDELSIRYNLPKFIIEDIVRSQFTFVRETIKAGENKTILLHEFGKFCISPKKLKWVNHHKQKKLNDLHSSGELIQTTKEEGI